jgi:competence protein ComEC
MPASRSALETGWRMAAAAVCWLAGIAAQMQQPWLWPTSYYLALCVGALAMLAAWRKLAGGLAGLCCLCLALGLVAYGSTGWRAAQRLAQVLPAELEGVDLQLIGAIDGLPQPGPQGTRFVLQVEQAQRDGQAVAVPERVSLGWYRGFDGEVLLAAPTQELRAGQRWLLTVRLRPPHGTLNPGGFDLELWMFE